MCLFCNVESDSQFTFVGESWLSSAIKDNYPITELHTLIIPKRHVETFFDLDLNEALDCFKLLRQMKTKLMEQDPTIEGFNIGMNCGEVAGQTVMHCHIHLIPRRVGDVENPRGGVRHVIPGKGNYEAK